MEEVEVAVEAVPVEQETPPATEETPPETYDKEKVAALISAAEASVQSAKDTQLAEIKRAHQKELREVKSRQEESDLLRQEESEKQRYGETDEELLKQLHEMRRRVFSTANQTADIQAQGYALKYGREYGVDPEVLMECNSPEEMLSTAKQKAQELEKNSIKEKEDKIKELMEKLAELEKAPQVVDSGVPNASGVSKADMSPAETIKYALDHPKK